MANSLEAIVARLRAVLSTRFPAMLDEVLAETAYQRVLLSSFVASTSEHSVTIDGTERGAATTGATQQAVLTSLHAAILAAESGYAGEVVGTGSSAELRVYPGVTATAGTNSVVANRTYLQDLGDQDDPTDVRDFTDENLPDPQYPVIYLEIEGDEDLIEYATDHEDIILPVAVHVVGTWGTEEKQATRIARLYRDAARRVLKRYAAGGGGIIHKVVVESAQPPIAWGDGAHGRAAIVRATAYRWEANAA